MRIYQRLALGTAIGAVLIAFVYPYLSNRLRVLSQFVTNRPSQLTEFRAFSNYDLKFRDELRNCEDAVIVEGDGLAILSCDAGRDLWNTVLGTFPKSSLSAVPPGELFIYRYNAPDHLANGLSRIELVDFPEASKFHPLGIEYHRASGRLFVSNHHFEGPRVEVFELDSQSEPPTARRIQTITSPLIRSPNSIVALNEHELFLSNDHFFQIEHNRILANIETYGGLPLGSIVHIDLHDNLSTAVRSAARLPYANGVALLDASTLAVASTSTSQIHLYEIRPDRTLKISSKVHVPFMPDNLATDQKGALLIGGHPHPPSLTGMVKLRQACLKNGSMLHQCHIGSAPSWVSEWTRENGLKSLYITAGEFGSSTSAVRDVESGLGLITGLYEKGILVWRE